MKKQALRLIAVAYLAAVLLFVLFGAGRLAKGTYYEKQGLRVHGQLELADLELVGVEPYENKQQPDGVWFVSKDGDPQLLLKEEVYLESVQLDMQRTKFGGATVLYWKKPGQENFSEAQSVYGKEVAPGSFVYELGGIRASEIRIDPDSVGGVVTRFDGLMLNPERSFWKAFSCGWKGLFQLLFLPLVFAAVLLEAKMMLKK